MNKHAETLINKKKVIIPEVYAAITANEMHAPACKKNEECILDFSFFYCCYRNFVCSVICSRYVLQRLLKLTNTLRRI